MNANPLLSYEERRKRYWKSVFAALAPVFLTGMPVSLA